MAEHPLSDYANTLDPHVKKLYLEKTSCVGIDPILVPDKTYDPECLSRVESMDLLSFLGSTRVITARNNLRLTDTRNQSKGSSFYRHRAGRHQLAKQHVKPTQNSPHNHLLKQFVTQTWL